MHLNLEITRIPSKNFGRKPGVYGQLHIVNTVYDQHIVLFLCPELRAPGGGIVDAEIEIKSSIK